MTDDVPRANIQLYAHGEEEDERRLLDAIEEAGYRTKETRNGYTLYREGD